MSSERSIGIDVCKALSAFLIVCIHCPLYGAFGGYVQALSRIAVPIFFMISGYFWHYVIEKNKEKQQIKKMLILIFLSNLLYFLWGCLFSFISGDCLIDYILRIFSLKSMKKLILFNESAVGGHLWYLNAILYTEMVFVCIYKLFKIKEINVYNAYKYFIPIIPILLSVDLIFGKYSLLFFNREYDYLLVRNFVFVGIPYFSLGLVINKICIAYKEKISKKILFISSIVFILLTLLEKFLLVMLDKNAARDHYLSTTLLAIVVFLLFVKIYDNRKATTIEKFIATIGRDYSTWIYILHPILITMFSFVANRIHIITIWRICSPMITYVSTILIIFLTKKAITCLLKKRIYN